MAANEKGPFAGTPQKNLSLKDFPALQAELQAMNPPEGCFWIEGDGREIVRDAINQAMAGTGRPDVLVLLEVDPEAAAKGWTPVRIEAGPWRFVAGIHGWRPGLKDAHSILAKLDPAGDPIDEVRELAVDLGNARQARTLLTDGRAAAARALAKASRTIWRAYGDVFQEALDPRNWTNPLPPDAQIEGLFYAVVQEDEAGDGE